MTDRRVSYQERHRALGLCVLCSTPVFKDGKMCRRHSLTRRLRARRKHKFHPWKKGGPGRPPVEVR